MLDLLQLRDGGLYRADHVALDDEVQVLDGALLELRVELLERDAALGLHRRALLDPQPLAALLGEVARLALGVDDARDLAGGRRLVEAEDLDRVARLRVLHALALVVVE